MDSLRTEIIDWIDDRRFDQGFPSLLYKDIEWIVDNCLLPRVATAIREARIDELHSARAVASSEGVTKTWRYFKDRESKLTREGA